MSAFGGGFWAGRGVNSLIKWGGANWILPTHLKRRIEARLVQIETVSGFPEGEAEAASISR